MDLSSCLLVLLAIAYSCCLGITYGQNTYNVQDYGATGNGKIDDTEAFLRAWETTCGANKTGTPTLRFPSGNTYLLKPLIFQGPCKSDNIQIQIDGDIEAPATLSEWKGCESGTWLHFLNVKGLHINGTGTINGRGYIWWNKGQKEGASCRAPAALGFHHCDNLQLRGFTSKDSPNKHIAILGCHGVTISNVHIRAPQTSPNTDGIMISASSQINIYESFIGTGDDCIAIKSGSSYINITHVACGPGHGISIGSLGVGNGNSTVEEVHVRNCSFNGTTNGARIKTWNGGSGYAKAISFEHITLVASRNPIIIDQQYPNSLVNGRNKDNAVKVSDITYRGFSGTSLTEKAIILDCSNLGCSGIVMEQVKLTSALPGKTVTSFCKNAQGKASSTTPQVHCLSKS